MVHFLYKTIKEDNKGISLKIVVNDKKVELQKKQRDIGSEAPAVKLVMTNGEEKVIGMMADKVQAIITVNNDSDITDSLIQVMEKYYEKANIYIISSSEIDIVLDRSMTSSDFKKLSLKMGVNIDDTLCAKSIFIINKDGEIVYKSIVYDIDGEFDLATFDTKLDEAIRFKKKGHTHENWMGV